MRFIFITGMNFRQKVKTIFFSNRANTLQYLPRFRLVQKIICTRFFGSVGKGVQADELRAIISQPVQRVLVELPH